MKTIRTIGAAALLVGMSVSLGCGVEVGDELGEPIDTETVGVFTIGSSFDPSSCTQTATECFSCDPANPSDCLRMHCCPFGQGMTGANIGENTFQCKTVAFAEERSCRLVRNGVRNFPGGISIRACPVGFYMKGLHAGDNALICCEYNSLNRSTSVSFDGITNSTQVPAPRIKDPFPWAGVCGDGFVHACPAQSVMEGYSIGNNWNLCGK